MPNFLRRYLPLMLIVALALVPLFVLRKFAKPIQEITAAGRIPAPPPRPALTPLAEPPDWSTLEPFQNSITRADFEKLLTTVFTTGEAWRDFIWIKQDQAIIQTNLPGDSRPFVLQFAPPGTPAPFSPKKSLVGLHIAIDPGHIGGAWAKMEERWFVLGGGSPVTEGDMTLTVANLLKTRLEALGAKISLVREKAEPVTATRPENSSKLAERLFYRTAEIHARAKLVNETLKPDLVLCLHFNAEAWGDPLNPTLVPHSHFHLLVNGAYDDEEVAYADQRFALIRKILQHTHEEETAIGATIASAFAQITKLPPYQYLPGAGNVRPIPGQPFLWARNLLANRLYDCPVLFLEPYVMNSTIDYPRIQAGNYEGLRPVNGQLRPSIFREYADAVTEGLRRYYALHRANGD